jgi:hypothetical protein
VEQGRATEKAPFGLGQPERLGSRVRELCHARRMAERPHGLEIRDARERQRNVVDARGVRDGVRLRLDLGKTSNIDSRSTSE